MAENEIDYWNAHLHYPVESHLNGSSKASDCTASSAVDVLIRKRTMRATRHAWYFIFITQFTAQYITFYFYPLTTNSSKHERPYFVLASGAFERMSAAAARRSERTALSPLCWSKRHRVSADKVAASTPGWRSRLNQWSIMRQQLFRRKGKVSDFRAKYVFWNDVRHPVLHGYLLPNA